MVYVDCVVVGCGISGISAGYHLQQYCPDRTFVILERRENLGGTWDLMTYPGIRSDSDMFTFGFGWRGWKSNNIISPGEEIMEYLHESVDEIGLRKRIEFNTNVNRCSFSSETCLWTVEASNAQGPVTFTCSLLFFNTGYYEYENPYKPVFDGQDTFQGKVIHPQHWDHTYDYKDKKVVVIGSGATAATLVPVLAERGAAHVTMLQRSPSYFVSSPRSKDSLFRLVRSLGAEDLAFRLTYYKYVVRFVFVYWICQTFPQTIKGLLMRKLKEEVPKDFDIGTHFNPSYGPWDQRVCLIPDGDFFEQLVKGTTDVVTDHIERFTENGILLQSGKHLEADLIVTATGLTVQRKFPMSTIHVEVDGVPYNSQNTFIYRSCMLSGIPNFVFTFGYANASWTLKADLVSKFATDLLNHMKRNKLAKVCPRRSSSVSEDPDKRFFELSSGYLSRARDNFPKLGSSPWDLPQNVLKDTFRMKLMPWGKDLEWTPLSRV